MRIIPQHMKGFRGLGKHVLSAAATPGAKAVPEFTLCKFVCAWQMSGENDDIACALMTLTQGKPLVQQPRLQPGIANALRTTDLTLFTEFFRRISAMYPLYFLTYKWKGTGQERKTLYGTFASDQVILYEFIHKHLLE